MLKTETPNVKDFLKSTFSKQNINSERKNLLKKIASKIAVEISLNGYVNVVFICTHNSRRSQIAQTWGFYFAHLLNLPIHSYSGGTEVTAFHRNSVKTLKDAGFDFNVIEFSHQNPVYEIFEEGIYKKFSAFSKTYDNPVNQNAFIAITTCNDADENCPFIPEATQRFHLPYKDPKYSDNSPQQSEVYLKTNKEIANEINYMFLEVKKQLNR